jgi:hypothetical protein
MPPVPPLPPQLEVALQQAMRIHRGGNPVEAEQRYRALLRHAPDHAPTNNFLGIALRDQGKRDEAVAVLRRIASIAPDYAPVQCNLGNVLFEQGQRAEAEACYRRALAASPDMTDALRNLGLVLVDDGRFEESFAPFRRHAELTFGRQGAPPPPAQKVRHDEEQRAHLAAAGIRGAASSEFHLEEGARVAGRAVSPDRSGGAVAEQWAKSSPQVVVIDDLLTAEALEALRTYCWRSTVWQRPYPNGYLGAMPEHGFAFPLLAQIADELRGAYPAIFGEHPLLRWWGFKYDSKLRGIDVHADFAAVNVNFWITPDEANLDAEHGGLVIWDTPAPAHWTLAEYNSPSAGPAIRALLERSGARPMTVPHRANRAVVFDSDLFHETDRIAFREGYENRRLNVTLLYGRR